MTSEKKTDESVMRASLQGAKLSDSQIKNHKTEQTPPDLSTDLESVTGFSRSKWIIFAGLSVIGLFFGLGGLWVSITEIDGAVIVPGFVKAEDERQTVQHLEGGIVKEIFVQEGDLVDKGEPLIVIEKSAVVGSVDQLLNQIYSKQIATSRLLAERGFLSEITWPSELLGASGSFLNEDVALMIASELKIFTSKRQALQGQVKIFSKQIDQIEKQIETLREQGLAAGKVVQSLVEELQAKQILCDDRFLEKSVVFDLQRRVAEAEGQREFFNGSVAESREKIAELKIKKNGLRNLYIEQAASELGAASAQLLDLRERLRPYEDARMRLTVTAPIAGEVVSLKTHSPGAVLPPGGEILDILPRNSALIVECLIQVQNITKIKYGKRVDVQLSAFNDRTHDKVIGHVIYVSADRQERQSPYGIQPFYQVLVSLDTADLRQKDLYVSAGMPVTVFFTTKPRTILDYALEPLSQNFQQAGGG